MTESTVPAGNALTGEGGTWAGGVGDGEGAGLLPPHADTTPRHVAPIKHRKEVMLLVSLPVEVDPCWRLAAIAFGNRARVGVHAALMSRSRSTVHTVSKPLGESSKSGGPTSGGSDFVLSQW